MTEKDNKISQGPKKQAPADKKGGKMAEELMTIDEVASYFKVATRTVYRMLKAKELPAFKVGGQWRFKKDDVDRAFKNPVKSASYNMEGSNPGGSNTVKVPLVGRVSCGAPILAEENIEGYIDFSDKIARPPFRYFLLRAQGDSMNTAGINNGDLVLVRRQQTAQPGDRVVALINDEATIKELAVNNGMAVLNPKSTNPGHRPIVMTGDFVIQGIVVSTITNLKEEEK